MGLVKSYMDDDIAQKVEEIKLRQNAKYLDFFFFQSYRNLPPFIVALKVAEHGGTAWQGHNER